VWRLIAWIALTFEFAGVIGVGVLSGLDPELFPAATVWSGFGRGYLYIPLVLPLVGFSYLETQLRQSRLRAPSEVTA
jgi:hypothetical protein